VKDPMVRFSVAIGGELLQKFDQYRELHHHPNRSEAVRGLMRGALLEEVITNDDSEAMGVVTLIYDHHASSISRRLTDLQHHHLDQVVTTTHVHLDARRCLEVILLRGPAREVRNLADDLIGTKGVETGRLVLASAKPIPAANGEAAHDHPHDHDHGDHHRPHPHPHAHKASRRRGN
jgi:CopG family nickel-responsive transcriptional regulator